VTKVETWESVTNTDSKENLITTLASSVESTSLLFRQPWGYKALRARIIAEVVTDSQPALSRLSPQFETNAAILVIDGEPCYSDCCKA
jgi:hypothetical protein